MHTSVHWDVIIIGAGPIGLAAAWNYAREHRDHKVLSWNNMRYLRNWPAPAGRSAIGVCNIRSWKYSALPWRPTNCGGSWNNRRTEN